MQPRLSAIAANAIPVALTPSAVTIITYGGLTSEASARTTFPHLTDFRLVRLHGLRRVFAHPHIFLVSRGLANPATGLQIGSLSVEPADGCSLAAFAFDVELDDTQREAFTEREREYDITTSPFHAPDAAATDAPLGTGVICEVLGIHRTPHHPRKNFRKTLMCHHTRSRIRLPFAAGAANTDDKVPEDVRRTAAEHGLSTLWHWPRDSGLEPADIYLRHCLLANEKAGGEAARSFLHDTYLADRTTTLAEYLATAAGERVRACRPPPDLALRFGG